MRGKNLFHTVEEIFKVSCILVLGASAGWGQASPPGNGSMSQDQAMLETMRQLQREVQELRQSVDELRGEAAQYRVETQQLREEITRARTEPAAGPSGLSGQPAAPPSNETEQRIAKVEDDLQLLSGKVDDQYQTKIESGSKYRVRVFGIALFNLFGNRGTVNNIEDPSLAADQGPMASSGSFGGTLRQSILGLETFGPQLAGAKTRADLQFDFAGGSPEVANGVAFGLARLRTATMRMDWANTSIVGGQDSLFFAPLSPTSFASLAEPPLSYAGNLWSWIPQLRVEHRQAISDTSNLTFKAGILDSLTGEIPNYGYGRQPTAGEQSGQPAYAAHVGYKHGASDRAPQVGMGAYFNRQDWGFQRKVDGWAAIADWTLPMSRWFALSGEFYRGRAIGGLSGGVGQTVLLSGPLADRVTLVDGLATAGGWAQLKFTPAPKWEFNSAWGLDNPYAVDFRRFPLPPGYLSERNGGFMTNMIVHPRSDLLFSFEYRHLRTLSFPSDIESANHFNVAMGVLF